MHVASNYILLSATIAALFSLVSPVGAVIEPETGAEWVASADEPGPDVPPVGRSLFDYLFTERTNGSAEYRVPFPFEKLTAQIEMYLRATSTRSLQKVLIPLGRSLQRNAASPHFFKSPRAVVAAEANPAPVPGEPLVVLKDRLYLGYQPSAAAIEVISYNEAAGRFEFQIVEDYRSDGKSKVYYAERSICLGCHQNHAPIFAIQPWDESNSNPSVSILLRREQLNFYGIPSFTGIDIPGLIGLSADRANLFSTYQLIWREGCGANDTAESTKCRANALLAALRYRLAADTHAGTRQDEARSTLVARFRETWPENWPTGIAIPSRELPDLDPFGAAKTYLGNGAIREVDILENLVPVDVVSIDDEYEPLYPRAPLDVWDLPRRMLGGAAMEPSWLDKFIAGLGAQHHGRSGRGWAAARPPCIRWPTTHGPGAASVYRRSAGIGRSCGRGPGGDRSQLRRRRALLRGYVDPGLRNAVGPVGLGRFGHGAKAGGAPETYRIRLAGRRPGLGGDRG